MLELQNEIMSYFYWISSFVCVFFKIDKTYKALEEEIHRFEIFKENVQKIEEHNKMYHLGKKSYYMGVNQFSDLVREATQKFFNYDILTLM